MAKKNSPEFSNDQLREMILGYFYKRNSKATSRKGKKGSAVKMKDIKSELKAEHGIADHQIISNLNYLISQRWVEEETDSKSFTNSSGITFPQKTIYYSITAKGMDKIDGPSQFTPKRFDGINIQATGSVVTIGDGNQINVKFKEAAEALSVLRSAISHSEEFTDIDKLNLVSDIDSIQTQLTKPTPNKSIIKTLWAGVEKTVTVGKLIELVYKASTLITPLLV